MGKKLIIKGANFSANAIIQDDYSTTTLYPLLVTTNSSSENYGKIVSNQNYISAKLPVALAAGQSVKYYVTNNNSIMTDVISGYILSTSDVPMIENTTIPNIVGGEKDISSNNGFFTVTNNTNSTACLYFIFAYSPATTISVSGKTAYYKILE